MKISLLNSEGLPWTVGISLPLTIVVIFISGGSLIVLLGLYLAYWLHRSYGRNTAVRYFGPLAGIYLSALVVNRYLTNGLPALFLFALSIFWLASEFILRHEIMAAFRENEGFELKISLIWTFLFGPIYLNYCVPPYTLGLPRK